MSEGTPPTRDKSARTLLEDHHVYIRTSRRTRYMRVSPLAQVLLLVAAFGWGFASFEAGRALLSDTVAATETEMRLDAQADAYALRLAEVEARAEALEAALADERTRASAAADRLAEAQQRVVDTTARLRSASAETDALRRELAGVVSAKGAAERRAELAEEALAAAVPPVDAALPAVEPETAAMDAIAAAIDTVIADRDRAARTAEALDRRLAALEAELEARERTEAARIERLESAARTSLEGLETLFDKAGLDVDQILEKTRAEYAGQGGPFEPLPEGAAPPVDETDIRLAALMGDLEQANLLRIAVDRLPFGRPVEGVRLTSDFGRRRDPIRRVWSMHSGVDWAGPRGTPIRATANGVVTFAGRQSGYGKIVIVQHAFGYETRYAHLDSMGVKVGDRVRRGDRIGRMGRTGRTTGVHLHYEVRIGAQAVNPAKFIEAARGIL